MQSIDYLRSVSQLNTESMAVPISPESKIMAIVFILGGLSVDIKYPPVSSSISKAQITQWQLELETRPEVEILFQTFSSFDILPVPELRFATTFFQSHELNSAQ